MTAIENKELRGITVKNLIITVMSTASIVASVITTYFGLKTEIQNIRASQETETRINNIRIRVLEDNVKLLQGEIDEITLRGKKRPDSLKKISILKTADPLLLTSVTRH